MTTMIMLNERTLTRELTKEVVQECHEAFDMFDMDHSGSIDKYELQYVIGNLGIAPDDDELDDMMKAVDLNGDGTVDFQEFLALMALRMDEQSRDPEEDLRDAFNMFDADGSGKIDRHEVSTLMKKLAQTLTDEELDQIMDEIDTDRDGEISFEEFRAMMFG